jgi:phosphoheptose isomerase
MHRINHNPVHPVHPVHPVKNLFISRGINMPYPSVNLRNVKTYPLPQRPSRVALENLVSPSAPLPEFEHPELAEVVERIVAARQAGRPVIWMIGAHVVKRGLSPILIDLMERGMITHLASNGAAVIHDFEIAFQGTTSEDVAKSLEDGSFGMAEETGRELNLAIQAGARQGLGIGESVGAWMAAGDRFIHRGLSLVYTAYRYHIPYTVHVAIGTDIIHQHPLADFGAIGWGSGQDFKIFTASVCELEGGVFCNFGSSVIGPEVFLKALSIARNLGHPVRVFTTANFDLLPLQDYRRPLAEDQTEYYYRPRKNIVNRPVSLGGKGFHISGDHRATIPHLHHQLLAHIPEGSIPRSDAAGAGDEALDPLAMLARESPRAALVLEAMQKKYPELSPATGHLARAFHILRNCFVQGGTLFVAGNGGSMADAIHISGELNKAFKRQRPVPGVHRQRLAAQPDGEVLADHLQPGLRTIVLGINPALSSAVDNDFSLAHAGLAQEFYALARAGDVFLGISTSGNAQNVAYTASVASALGCTVLAMTGEGGGRLAQQADVVLHAPAQTTPEVQNWHIILYHTLCAMLEDTFWGDEG